MYKVLIAVCVISVNAYAQTNGQQTWEYIGEDSTSLININSQSQKLYIPFENKFIYRSVIDTLLITAVDYERKDALGVPNVKNPPPRAVVLNDQHLLYSKSFNVKVNCKRRRVYLFMLSKTQDFNEHDRYDMYYIKGSGFIILRHRKHGGENIFFNYDYFILRDFKAKSGHQIIRRKEIEKILKKIRGY